MFLVSHIINKSLVFNNVCDIMIKNNKNFILILLVIGLVCACVLVIDYGLNNNSGSVNTIYNNTTEYNHYNKSNYPAGYVYDDIDESANSFLAGFNNDNPIDYTNNSNNSSV